MFTSYRFLSILIVLILLIGCTEEKLDLATVITFENPATESVQADNLTEIKLQVKITAAADADKRKITFTTDLGTFTNGQNTIDVLADADGYAETYLKGDKVGTATVKATVLSTYSATKTVRFENANLDAIVRFENPATDSVQADNLTELRLRAVVNKDAPVDRRRVKFETDLGTFTNGQNTIDVLADADGYAETYLKGDKVGTATVKASVGTYSQQKSVTLVPISANDVVRFDSVIADNVPADGVSTIAIKALINKNVPPDKRIVSFKTDAGSFVGGGTTPGAVSVTADAEGVAVAYLRSNTEGPAHVSISNQDVTRNRTFTFSRALPERIEFVSAPLTITAGFANQIKLDVMLRRTVGEPSRGFLIDWTATDSTGREIGTFRNNVLSNETGNASVNYSAGDTDYRGVVTLRAAVNGLPNVSPITTTIKVVNQ